MAALGRSGDRRFDWMALSSVLIAVVLVACAVAVPAPKRERVALTPTTDVHGVLRPTELVVTDVDVYRGTVVAAVLAVTSVSAPSVVANGLRLLAAGSGPLVSVRHLQGHLRT